MNTQHGKYFGKLVKRWNSNRWGRRYKRFGHNKHRASRIAVFGAVAMIAASSVLFAEDATTSTELSEVVVSGDKGYRTEKPQSNKYSQPLRNTPQTISVVPQAAIQEQNATTLRDVLRNVSGVTMQAGEGGVPNGDNLSIRGFNARTDIFVDGLRDIGGYSRDPFNIQQVEVAKGPSSVYGGRGSTGGSVNMVTKSPALDSFYGGSFGVGTEEYLRGTVDVNQHIGGSSAFRLNAMWTESEVANRDVVESERWGIAPSLAFGLGTPTRLNLYYTHLEQSNIPDYGIPWVTATHNVLRNERDKPAPVDYSNWYGLKARDYEDTDTDIGTVAIEHDFNDAFTLRNATRYGETVRDSVVTAPRFVSDNTTNITRQLQSRDQVDTLTANVTDLTSRFNTGVVKHTLLTGVEFDWEKSTNHAREARGPAAPVANFYNPDPNQPYLGTINRNGAKTEADADSIALYAFDTIGLTEKLDLSVGLRWDSFDVDYVSVSSIPTVARTNLSRKDEMISWRTGLVFKPTESGSIYAAYGTSFNPSAEALTLGNTATSTNNINTDPEENRSYEVGTKWDLFQRRLSTALAFFRTEKKNARTEDPTVTTDIVVLEGEQRVDGFEVSAAGSITDNWSMLAAYSHLDSEVTKSKSAVEVGRKVSNTPENSVSLWSTYELPWNLQVGAGGQFVDARYSSNTNARKAPSYWTADATVAWEATNNLTFRVNGYNLLDEMYIDRVGGGHFVPGAGRSATFTTDVKF